jgi:hypothetical protein
VVVRRVRARLGCTRTIALARDHSARGSRRKPSPRTPEALGSLMRRSPAESLMRDQFSVQCPCPHCHSEDVTAVRTRESTYWRCNACRDVWRERHRNMRDRSDRYVWRRSRSRGGSVAVVPRTPRAASIVALPLLILAVIATALADPYVKRRHEVRRRPIRFARRERAPQATPHAAQSTRRASRVSRGRGSHRVADARA